MRVTVSFSSESWFTCEEGGEAEGEFGRVCAERLLRTEPYG